MRKGYFLVHRKLLDHSIADNPLMVALWVRLLADANYEDDTVYFGKQTLLVKRGQLITSIEKLSKWLHLSRTTTKRHLTALQTIRQIDIKTTNKYVVITIRNYDKYQTNGHQNGQETIQQTDTKKEYKEYKQVNTNVLPQKIADPLEEKPKEKREHPYTVVIEYCKEKQGLATNFVNYVKQTTACKKIISAGYSEADIRFVIEEMVADPYWRDNTFDLMNVANNMHKYLNRTVYYNKKEGKHAAVS